MKKLIALILALFLATATPALAEELVIEPCASPDALSVREFAGETWSVRPARAGEAGNAGEMYSESGWMVALKLYKTPLDGVSLLLAEVGFSEERAEAELVYSPRVVPCHAYYDMGEPKFTRVEYDFSIPVTSFTDARGMQIFAWLMTDAEIKLLHNAVTFLSGGGELSFLVDIPGNTPLVLTEPDAPRPEFSRAELESGLEWVRENMHESLINAEIDWENSFVKVELTAAGIARWADNDAVPECVAIFYPWF